LLISCAKLVLSLITAFMQTFNRWVGCHCPISIQSFYKKG